MIRIRRPCKISLMARIAIRGRTFELPILMARGAIGRSVRAGKRERSRVMIECGRFPCVHRMARRAIVRELRRDMVRRRRGRKLRLMACIAIRRGTFEKSVLMARGAIGGEMRSRQWEIGLLMIECGRFPRCGRMARRAIVR